LSSPTKRTPFAYTPTFSDAAVAVDTERGVIIIREEPEHAHAAFWRGFQRLLDGPRNPVDWQAPRFRRRRPGAGLLAVFNAWVRG
jgi:hypothetical protein